jgi:hypothetical protein
MDSSSLVASAKPAGELASNAAEIDPAEKLRAAALSTLKRRKPPSAAVVSLPTRPAALRGSASASLDYGAADSSSSSLQQEQQLQEPTPTPSTQGLVRTKSSEEHGPPSREEGEISDSEMAVDDVVPSKPRLAKKRFMAASSAADRKSAVTNAMAPAVAVVPPERQEQSLLDRIGDQVDTNMSSQAQTRSPSPPKEASPEETYVIDAEHVRPGLESELCSGVKPISMYSFPPLIVTQEQYNTVKEIILDILGWGVAPEYLIDCGISPITLFYAFHELNLRLPQNLDLSTIPIYDPKTRSYIPQRQRRSSIRQAASARAEISLASRISHPLPAKPGSTAVAPVPVSPVTTKTPDVDLHNLEQERRRLLLLRRKNTQESKNNTGANSPTGSSPEQPTENSPKDATNDKPADKDVEMAPAVPAEVDEFLNSIGSGVSLPPADPPRFPSTTSSMDIDMDSANESLPPPPSTGDSILSFATAPPLSAVSSISEATVDSRNSNYMRRSPSLEAGSIASGGESSGSTSLDNRRAPKRPVASDFADYEPASKPIGHHHGANGHHSNGSSQPMRRIGSFAGISTMRRCIIDLSDSEDEDDEGNPAASSSSTVIKPITRPPVLSRQAGTTTPTTATPTPTPSALVEKEREIIAMREMIARREAIRSRKMVNLFLLRYLCN